MRRTPRAAARAVWSARDPLRVSILHASMRSATRRVTTARATKATTARTSGIASMRAARKAQWPASLRRDSPTFLADGGDWRAMAWWIHDHLPYSVLYFYPALGAFNISWHEEPERRIDSYIEPRGTLTKVGMANHAGSHAARVFGVARVLIESRRTIASASESPANQRDSNNFAPLRNSVSASGAK